MDPHLLQQFLVHLRELHLERTLELMREAQAFSTVGIVLAIFLARELLVRALYRRTDLAAENKRRWTSHIRNSSFLLLAIALILVWFPQLQTFALSITAFAVAIIIATKELILCLSGSVLRATTNSFSVGDLIEIDELCGEVVEHNLMSTTVMEVSRAGAADPYQLTGRRVVLPNSLFLSKHLVNYGLMRRYVFHRFALTFPAEQDAEALEAAIRDSAGAAAAELGEVAQRYHAMVANRSGLDLPGAEPRVHLATTNLGSLCFTIVLFCPIRSAAAIERQVTFAALRASRELRRSQERPDRAAD